MRIIMKYIDVNNVNVHNNNHYEPIFVDDEDEHHDDTDSNV